MKKLQPKVKVKRSKAGLGLFAGQDIKKGTFVIEYLGPILNNDQADAKAGKYLFEVSSTKTIDGSPRWNTARYINHACRPNCESRTAAGRVRIYAIKNIAAGEELTYHYGKTYFKDFITKERCLCDSCVKRRAK